ncbi:MAG: SMP-30/gluconolactonase/LRE family protein [Dehalococcoidia bacterium]
MTRVTKTLLEGLHFGEGPRWHDGKLYFSDFNDYAVKTVTEDGVAATVCTVPNQPSGLGWLPDGRMLIVSMIDRKLLRLEPDGRLVEHADLWGIATYHCNDMVVDAKGRAYVGNFGFDLEAVTRARAAGQEAVMSTATLARVDPDGSVHVAAEDMEFPNGSVVTPDGGTLIVGESMGRRLTAFTIAADGSLSGRRVWADTAPAVPDGICLDAEGCIWIANPAAPECLRIREGGEVVDRVQTTQQAYACMLGGADGKTLFVLTAKASGEAAAKERSGKVEVVRVDVPHAGLP